jgi:hypothetical protein
MRLPAALVLIFTAFVTGTLSSHSQAPPSQEPVRVVHLHLDGGLGPPRNLDELLQRSALVAEGVVEGARPDDRAMGVIGSTQEVMVRTAYTFRVRQAFKAQPVWDFKGLRVDVVFPLTGDRDRGEYVERFVNDRLQPLRVGDLLLLFLKRSGSAASFEPVTDDDASVFEVKGDRVVARDTHAPTSSIGKDGWSKLQTDLRSRSKGSGL